MILLLAVAALAHPFGNTSASHRSELRLGTDTVSLRYTAEIPADVVRANARLRPGSDPVAATSSELLAGLLLTVDGSAVPLTVEGPAQITPDRGAYTITLSLSGPLPRDAHRVELSNANLPEVRSYWSCAITVGRELVVEGASVLTGDRDTCPEWRTGEVHRTLTVDVRRARLGERARDWLLGAPAHRGLLAAQSQRQSWRSGTINGPVLVAMMLTSAALGGLTGTRNRLAVSLAAAALVVALAALAVPPGFLPWMDLVLACLVGVGSMWPRWGAWIGVAALAATGQAPRLTVVLAGIAWLAALLASRILERSSPPTLVSALLRVTAGWLVLRGLLGLLAQV